MTTRDARGHAIYEAVFGRTEILDAAGEIEHAPLKRSKAGARHVLLHPVIQRLAHDRRMLDLASRFVGHGATPFRATLFSKSRSSNWLIVWHQDTALPLRGRVDDRSFGPWSTKGGVLYAHAPAWALEAVIALRLHLDDSTATNGPLRVLPETHRDGVLSDAQVQERADRMPQVSCLVDAGGVIAMRPLTIHSSSKSTDDRPRRVLHIEYAAALDLRPGVTLAVA